MKNRSQRYDIKRPRPRHGHKYSKYEMCLNIMMEAQFITKSRNTQVELKKSVAYEKSLYIENENLFNMKWKKHFKRPSIEEDKTKYFGRWESDFKS